MKQSVRAAHDPSGALTEIVPILAPRGQATRTVYLLAPRHFFAKSRRVPYSSLPSKVNIHIIETEREEQGYYADALAGRRVVFGDLSDPVPEETEILSVFINTTVDRFFLERLPRLRMLATRSRAVDHIDLDACRERGITICHVPESGETSVAEHTFALILALSRRLREFMLVSQQSHAFSYEGARAFDLLGKTIGIVGMGKIGRRVCELARVFGMQVVASDVTHAEPPPGAGESFRWLPLEELLPISDVVTLHLSLTPASHHLLNRRTLALCKRGAFIINTARGRMIDTEALSEALESGQIGGAGLDVLENESVLRQPASSVVTDQILERLHGGDPVPAGPRGRLRDLQKIIASDALLSRPNVVFTPHVAFNSIEAVEKMAEVTVRNIREFCAGTPVNVVP